MRKENIYCDGCGKACAGKYIALMPQSAEVTAKIATVVVDGGIGRSMPAESEVDFCCPACARDWADRWF